jgi:SAM-dependent methyltransferase
LIGHRLLSAARAYSLSQNLLGVRAARRRILSTHVGPQRGERFLDLGCGPGDMLQELRGVRYTGLDLSPRYVRMARRRFGDRGEFVCGDFRELARGAHGPFDVVVVMGVIHHLSDHEASSMVEVAASVLTDQGRFHTIDPTLIDGQSRIARWLIARDRGEHVRRPEQYRVLAAQHFGSVDLTVRHDLLRVPYTHALLECRLPRRPSSL